MAYQSILAHKLRSVNQSVVGNSEDTATRNLDLVAARKRHDYETPITRCVAYGVVGVQESDTSERPPEAVYETIT